MDSRRQCGAAVCSKSENNELKFHLLNLLRSGIGGQKSTDSGQYSPDAFIAGTGTTGKGRG